MTAEISPDTTHHLDALLDKAVAATPTIPGVVAGLTDRENITYLGAAGTRSLNTGAEMTTDTVLAIFSMSKAITGVTALQLAESGDLDLDAPAKVYLPELGDIQVLDGFADDGTPQLRAPRTDITTRQLMLHTAGFGYEFLNENYKRLVESGHPSVITATRASITSPLHFDPGTQWEYGINIDWLGQVVEAVAGKRLGEVMSERIFAPLDMHDTAFVMSASAAERRASVHQRVDADTIVAVDDLVFSQDPEVQMGGQGLYSTVPDFLRFQRMWLNDGASDSGHQVLTPKTVQWAVQNGLGDLKVRALPGVMPNLTHDVEFYPEQPTSWAHTFLVNDEDAPSGRPAGSIGWAGLANLYFWIDRKNGIAGCWATQVLPFLDPISYKHATEFETTTYRALTS